jgi:pyruvate dehydrogenase E2 component (dihydrolipoyllysine-residue acetyltransferase)
MTYQAEREGVLRIVAGEGDTLAVGVVIATLDGGRVATAAGPAKGDVRVEELSRAQSLVARRTAESKATIPDFSLDATVDMEAAVALLAELDEAAAAEQGSAPTVDDLVVTAAARALVEHPRANGSYRDGRFELFGRVNVGVAVAAHDTIVVPTIFDADRKPLGEIAREARALADRVRAGVVTPPELGGATFTVSSLGRFGIRSLTPVINPPQAAILGVGAVEPRAAARDGAVVVRHQLDLRLVCDHRILYGAQAARFLGRIRELLEQPRTLPA